MAPSLDQAPSTIDRIRHDLVGLKMPQALEAIDILLADDLTLRENSRIKMALWVGRPALARAI